MYSPSLCMCRLSKSLYRSRSRLFHMQIYVSSHLIGGAWTRAFLCKWVSRSIHRSRDHSFFIRSLQNPTLKIARHVNTTQTAIMSAWHYCFIPPICSSRLYILITISKHDAGPFHANSSWRLKNNNQHMLFVWHFFTSLSCVVSKIIWVEVTNHLQIIR